MNKYKLNRDFILQFDKQKLTIFDPENSQLYTLNRTATLILKSLDEGLTIEEIINNLLKEYSIDYSEAEKEVLEITNYFLSEKIIK